MSKKMDDQPPFFARDKTWIVVGIFALFLLAPAEKQNALIELAKLVWTR